MGSGDSKYISLTFFLCLFCNFSCHSFSHSFFYLPSRRLFIRFSLYPFILVDCLYTATNNAFSFFLPLFRTIIHEVISSLSSIIFAAFLPRFTATTVTLTSLIAYTTTMTTVFLLSALVPLKSKHLHFC